MAEVTERDAALLLDMLLAARDAGAFLAGMDEATPAGCARARSFARLNSERQRPDGELESKGFDHGRHRRQGRVALGRKGPV